MVECDALTKRVKSLEGLLEDLRQAAIPQTDTIVKKIGDAEYAVDSKVLQLHVRSFGRIARAEPRIGLGLDFRWS